LGQRQHKRKARQAALPATRRAPDISRNTSSAASPAPLLWVGLSAGIAVLIAVAYAQVRQFDFVYLDDPVYVVNNEWVRKGLSLSGVKWSLTALAAGNWHPLTWISHMVDIQLFGLDAGRHHVTSVVIHAINSILLFVVLSRMTARPWLSGMVAALFAIHPLHVESVAWISERKDVLSAFFWILTLNAYVSYCRKPNPARYLVVVLLFVLGLMSKPMVVTLPFTLLLLDYWPLKRLPPESVTRPSSWLPLIREKVPLFLLTLASTFATVKAQRGYGAVVALEQFPLKGRIANSIVAYIAYLRDLLWPARLAAYYPFERHSAAYVAVSLVIFIGMTAIALIQARRRPYILFGWAWYVGTLIPAIGLVQVGDQARADRYTYVPAIGLFIVIVWLVTEIASRWNFSRLALPGAAIVVLSACTAISIRQVSYWRNNLSLFTRAVAVTRQNYRAEALLGVAYSASGKHQEAVKHYRSSLAIWDGNAEVHTNLGASLFAIGESDEALRQFSEAVRYKPDNALYRYNYGVMLVEKGREHDGISEVRKSTELDPANKQYRDGLEILLAKQKR